MTRFAVTETYHWTVSYPGQHLQIMWRVSVELRSLTRVLEIVHAGLRAGGVAPVHERGRLGVTMRDHHHVARGGKGVQIFVMQTKNSYKNVLIFVNLNYDIDFYASEFYVILAIYFFLKPTP